MRGFSEVERGIDAAFAKKRFLVEKEKEQKFIDEAYKRAVEHLEDEGQIDPGSFRNYDPAIIGKDLMYVKKMREMFEAEATPEHRQAQKLATILEAILHEQIELNEWLGPDVQTRKASQYDDIKNGVDSIVDFRQDIGVQHLALALDVTYSGRTPVKKLERIRNEIDSEELSTVKYFESSDGTYKGSLYQVPRVVIGSEKNETLALAELWMQKKNKELARHPIQLKILDEISMQLQAFITYAEKHGKTKIVEIYSRQLRLIESIQNSSDKKELAAQSEGVSFADDQVFASLRDGLGIFA